MVEIPSRPVKVGVLLDRVPGDLTAWLADAAAFDAGGADALWVDCEPDPLLDVVALTAALAVVTHRARLVVALPEKTPAATSLHTIVRLTRGRLALIADSGDPAVFRRDAEVYENADERWLPVPVPDGREAWQEVRSDAAAREFTGLVVPVDPRVLDLLRNPDDPGDRRDLQLAQG